MTDILGLGFWPSFNIPFFKYIYNVSNYEPYFLKYGWHFSYEINPRMDIFRRDEFKVISLSLYIFLSLSLSIYLSMSPLHSLSLPSHLSLFAPSLVII